jgi:type III pantothenate kinase
MKHIVALMIDEVFGGRRPWIVGTGGFCRLFERENLFDEIVPDLVLRGLWHAERMNREENQTRVPGGKTAALAD